MPNPGIEEMTWKREYWKLLLSGSQAQAAELKKRHYPIRLFKFMRLSEYAIDAIDNNTIFVAPLDALNDPFEGTLTITKADFILTKLTKTDYLSELEHKYGLKLTENDIKGLVGSPEPFTAFRNLIHAKGFRLLATEEEFFENFPNWVKPFLDFRKTCKVCSFTERFDSVLMWAHYADQHRGICVEYDFSSVVETILALDPVLYTDQVYSMTISGKAELNVLASILTKSEDWSYEKEWRIVFFSPKYDKYRVPKPTCVYLGSKISDGDNYKLFRVIDKLAIGSVPIKKMIQHPSKYIMTPVDVDVENLKRSVKEREDQKNINFFGNDSSAAPGSSIKKILYKTSGVDVFKEKDYRTRVKLTNARRMKLLVFENDLELIGKENNIFIANVRMITYVDRLKHILVDFGEEYSRWGSLGENTVILDPVYWSEFLRIKAVMSTQVRFHNTAYPERRYLPR